MAVEGTTLMNVCRPLLPIILALALAGAGCGRPTVDVREWRLAGVAAEARAEVYARTADGARGTLDEIEASLKGLEESLLSGRDAGALGRLNRRAAEDYYSPEDRDLYRCVLLALDYGKASGGAFDPTVGALLDLYERTASTGRIPTQAEIDATLPAVGWPKVAVADEPRALRFRRPGMKLDLGGVARGFALDVAARTFARPGCIGGLLSIGGNAYAWGEHPGGKGWPVPLPDPRDPGRTLLTVRVANRGVAVSGQTDDLAPVPDLVAGLILDPSTGGPVATDLIAAVAIADSGADADALATALLVAGSTRGAQLLRKMRQVEAILVVRGDRGDPHILASASLRDRLEPGPALAEESAGPVRFLLPPDAP
jgi:thiamine biosynthesis lipoprotein